MLIVFALSHFAVSRANDTDNDNLFQGEKAQEIDGMLHAVNYLYGSPAYNNSLSMLASMNVTVYPEDRIFYFPDPSFALGSKIIIKRANAIIITDGGIEKTYRTWKTTVRAVFEENNISVGDKDVVDVNLDQKLSDLAYNENRGVVAREGRNDAPVIGKINITRVAEAEIKQQEKIAYKVITKKDPDLEKGKTRVETVGQSGVRELTYKVRQENGIQIAKDLVENEIIKDSIDKVVYEGTKITVYGIGTATWYDLIGGMTAASNTLTYGTMVHVVNPENGKSVDVKIVDHGIKSNAIIDLSKEAFQQLSPLGKGVIQVRLEKP